MEIETRHQLVTDQFQKFYGAKPAIWSRAPGRVDLMGSHTDYNLGFVMTMTIDRDTWIAARPRSDRSVNIHSLNVRGHGDFSLDYVDHDTESPWTNYVRGMAKTLQDAGIMLGGFDGLIHSTIPFGSGLSSSAAIEMATAMTFAQVTGSYLDPVQMARLGQKAENEFVGVASGILDQYSSAMGQEGHALLLDCRRLRSRAIPIPPELRVVICDTRSERHLVGSEYDERRAQCQVGVELLRQWYPSLMALGELSVDQFEAYARHLPEVVARRCRFIVEENQRVLDLAEALWAGERAKLGELFANSFAGAAELYEISVPAMRVMHEAMLSGPGVVGARQAGAGFGGCLVALVEESATGDFARHVEAAYAERTGIRPPVYCVRAAPCAGPLEWPVQRH